MPARKNGADCRRFNPDDTSLPCFPGDRASKLRFGPMSEYGRYVNPLRASRRGDFKLRAGRGLAGAGV